MILATLILAVALWFVTICYIANRIAVVTGWGDLRHAMRGAARHAFRSVAEGLADKLDHTTSRLRAVSRAT